MVITVIVSNKCQCRRCGDIIESVFKHNLVYCRCNSIYIDGGTSRLVRGALNLDDILEMSETYEMECNL